MGNFTSNERFIASLLSATPGLKKFVKKIYIWLNAVIYRKSFTSQILCDKVAKIEDLLSDYLRESFWGYYDKFSLNKNGILLSYLSDRNTRSKPASFERISLVAIGLNNGNTFNIGTTSSYTWQQGSRAQWLNDNELIYNDFRDGKYKAVVYSLNEQCELKVFDFPVQDSYQTDYFLSVNYRRIMYLRPDYGYRNIQLPTLDEMKDLSHDGIWRIDYKSGKSVLLYSLQDIVDCESKDLFGSCLHKVNHIMINKSGSGFIFIHRFYQGKRRFDRLLFSDFKSLKVLIDDEMVSHCCWVDDRTIFGYFRYQSKNGYYYCDIQTGIITPCLTMTNLNLGDGHPSCYGDWIVFDSYPDKSRMQHLFLYNRKSDTIIPLLELYHSVRFADECRCDLHPRFSEDGRYISFDTVYTGKRRQCYIDISRLL